MTKLAVEPAVEGASASDDWPPRKPDPKVWRRR